MQNPLDSDIKFLPGVGQKRAELLNKELGIFTIGDLLHTYPFRYIDRTKIYSIKEIEPSMPYIQLRGKIGSIGITGEGRGKQRMIVKLYDATGNIDLIFFQGIKWMKERLRVNQEYIVFGRPSVFNSSYNIVHPEMDPISEATTEQYSAMTGVYSSTERLRNNGIGNKTFSKLIQTAITKYLDYIKESLPDELLKKHRLAPLKFALLNIHYPKDVTSLNSAQFRLKFEELFYLQLSLLRQKNIRMRSSSGVVMKSVGNYFNTSFANLKFELTGAQKRVIREIRNDMRSGLQMNRLLQGDVGSGKTLVAVFSAMIAADNGYQSCIMAPTEVLAVQHYNSIHKIIKDTGIRVALLTGSTKAKERREIAAGLEDGSIHILFGTHAVIEDNVKFKNLGLSVIDEQHRFGVEQRARLWSKSEITPHVLVMTATPIPRTLAMTLFGDLDVSVLDELPPGRKPVTTMHATEKNRGEIFRFVKDQIKSGRQIFIVYPLIKESEKMDYKNLEEGYQIIVERFPAPEYITAVVHGKQKNEDKAHDMKLFADGKAHILVATSVIEVGVDVPNASVMIIESAERFGLSQLHQLRGRVGRGSDKSYCILMTGYKLSKESRQRIELMCSTNDGFELAEADLRMRGPGDFEGTQQSGLAVDLKISNLARDSSILELARNAADSVLERDPQLESESNRILREVVASIKNPVKDYSKIS